MAVSLFEKFLLQGVTSGANCPGRNIRLSKSVSMPDLCHFPSTSRKRYTHDPLSPMSRRDYRRNLARMHHVVEGRGREPPRSLGRAKGRPSAADPGLALAAWSPRHACPLTLRSWGPSAGPPVVPPVIFFHGLHRLPAFVALPGGSTPRRFRSARAARPGVAGVSRRSPPSRIC